MTLAVFRMSVGLPLASLLSAVVVALLPVETATAAEDLDEPYAMTLVDATPQESGPVHRKMRTIVADSEDIDFRDPDRLLADAQHFEVGLDVLGSTRKRASHRQLIRRAMRANDLEAIVVFKRVVDTLHFVVIGPTGAELRHFREQAPKGVLDDERAIAYLEQIFEVLVPEIRAFRRQREKLEDRRGIPEADTGGAPSDTQTRGATDRGREATLQQHLTVTVSPLFGRRQLTIETERDFRLAHSTPFVGVEGRVDAILGLVSSESSAVGARGYVDYAPFSSRLGQDPTTYDGTFFRAGGSIRYFLGLSSRTLLFGELGGEVLDIGIVSNRVYVGSQYAALRGGVGIQHRFSRLVGAELAASALPTLHSSTNETAFGDGAFSVGAAGDGRFSFYGLDPLVLSAYYTFELYRPDHPKPARYQSPASGTDFLHLTGVSVGYRF